jgi:hypothetical protein
MLGLYKINKYNSYYFINSRIQRQDGQQFERFYLYGGDVAR